LVFIKTDQGIIGFGEGTPYFSTIYKDSKAVRRILNRIRGLSLTEAWKTVVEFGEESFKNYKSSRYNYGAFLAMESAILDAIGKEKRFRVAELLGGVYREVVPVCGTVFLKHPKKMAEEVNKWLMKNIKHIKIKVPCNLDELETTLKTIVENTHSDETDIVLRADANGCFKNVDKGIKALKIMESYGIDIVEQPLPKKDIQGLKRLRKLFYPSIKIMIDESLTRPDDVRMFAEQEVADIINFHPSKLGCLTITRNSMLEARKLGFEVQIGSSLMTDIGVAQYTHLAASLPTLDYPLEEVGLCEFYGYCIARNPQTINGGAFTLPSKKGLGVLLKFSSIKKFLVREFLRPSVFNEMKNMAKLFFLKVWGS